MENNYLIAAVLCLFAFLALQKKLNTKECVRPNNPEEWKHDWDKIKDWTTFVEDCSGGARNVATLDVDGQGAADNTIGTKFVTGTRCSTTAYSARKYFCGDGEQRIIAFDSKEFIKILEKTKENKKNDIPVHHMIFSGYVGQRDDNGKGHVYIIQSLPNGKYSVYQSFIMKYTLGTHMNRYKKSFSGKEMIAMMREISKLDGVKEWTFEASQIYEKYFGVKYEDFGRLVGLVQDQSIDIHFELNCFPDVEDTEAFGDD